MEKMEQKTIEISLKMCGFGHQFFHHGRDGSFYTHQGLQCLPC